ncbi:Arylsulfatase [Rubripirellula obstinata]|uniref:Arylsulfatase n=1 Tax=Rubripirellula obstinata TaxID=406547 RepID=A0A5B1CMV4_9BACT|nr:sulfatase [Rubripirellula obstinata]KAA1261119.1 Arylsulfatase [Rubripirellula obstinata]
MIQLNCFLIAALALCSTAFAGDESTNSARPNVLFVMSDDHTSQAIGAYGSRLAALNPTPTIDRLAAEGMRFNNVVCTNSICVPSRASIITGQYPHMVGCHTLMGGVPAERQYLAHAMNDAGYQTAIIGKWHLHDRPEAFDHYQVLIGQGEYFDPRFRVRGQQKPMLTQGHSSDVITDSTLKWLAERDDQKPFFLMLHYKAPHDMFDYAPRYESYLADTFIPEPASMYSPGNHGSIATRGANDELTPYIGTSVSGRNLRRNYFRYGGFDDKFSANEATSRGYQYYLKRYLRCVKGVDDNLARVIKHLEDTDQLDNTLIVYTGDQGFWLGEHDYMDKRWGYEESLKMPLIVRYPKSVSAGSVNDSIIENIDFAPTLIDFAGGKAPDVMQGKSFASLITTGDEPANWKEAAYYQYWMHMIHHEVPAHLGIRTKRFKLLFFTGTPIPYDARQNPFGEIATPPGWELYDLEKDPQEMNNVIDDPSYAAELVLLKKQLADLREQAGAARPEQVDDPEVKSAIANINRVAKEFWDDTPQSRIKAAKISAETLQAIKDNPYYVADEQDAALGRKPKE